MCRESGGQNKESALEIQINSGEADLWTGMWIKTTMGFESAAFLDKRNTCSNA